MCLREARRAAHCCRHNHYRPAGRCNNNVVLFVSCTERVLVISLRAQSCCRTFKQLPSERSALKCRRRYNCFSCCSNTRVTTTTAYICIERSRRVAAPKVDHPVADDLPLMTVLIVMMSSQATVCLLSVSHYYTHPNNRLRVRYGQLIYIRAVSQSVITHLHASKIQTRDDRPRREISGSCCPVQTSSKFKLVRFIRQKSFPMSAYVCLFVLVWYGSHVAYPLYMFHSFVRKEGERLYVR